MIDAGNPKLSHEAQLFSRYLLGETADGLSCELYDKATATLAENANAREKHVLAFALAHPRMLPSLDAALALTNPRSLLRQKLLTAAAILETRPAHHAAFFPRERAKTYALAVLFTLTRAACRACAGLLLLRWIR